MKNLAQQETWFPLMFRPIRSIWGREVMAELLGNFVFVTIGLLGSVWSSTNCGGNHLVLQPIIWGMAMTCGMFVCGGYSGGQLNPAVNVGFWVLNRNRRRVKLLNKMFAQCAGAFLASAFVIVFSYQWLFAKYGTNWLKNNEVISIFAPKLSSSMDDWGIVALEMFVAAFMFTRTAGSCH
ncbi:hypothetical protein HDE_14264 [Halotydeus destructor]|nr:hypothetical protein HDE_14264 [Halotydeus destructor]